MNCGNLLQIYFQCCLEVDMKRYDFEEDDDEDDFDSFEQDEQSITPQEYKDILEDEQAIQHENIELTYQALNQRLIDRAYKICKNSFWFKFYNLDTQLKKISMVFNKLKDLQEF